MAIKSPEAKARKRIKSLEYARAHKEERSIYTRLYCQHNIEKIQNYRDSRKEKQRELSRDHYLKHKEEKSIITKARREENPEHFREICRKSYQSHRQVTINRTTKYLQEHPEVRLKSQRNYRKNHPELRGKYDRERRLRKFNALGNHTYEQWIARIEFYGWRCKYCKVQLDEKSLTMDHIIPLNKGGSNWASNLAPACKPCNSSKQDKKLNEFKGRKAV